MKRTAFAAAFVLASGLIGAMVALILLGPNTGGDAEATGSQELSSVAALAPPSHIVSDYRVAVRFPDRFEFDRESDGEVVYWDPQSNTRIAFVVTRLGSGAAFEDIVDAMERRFAIRGVVERREALSDTHVELTTLEIFRVVTEAAIFLAEDCWGAPLVVRAAYIYDRTSTPQEFWITQVDPDFPQFEFAYRCPS